MSASRINRKSLNRRITKYVRFSLTNAQLLALFTTPISVLGAPANSNFVHIIDCLYLTQSAPATPMTIGSATGITLNYTNGSGAAATGTAPVTGFLDQSTAAQSFADSAAAFVPVAGAAIVIKMLTANVSAGTGGLSGRIYFRTLPAVV